MNGSDLTTEGEIPLDSEPSQAGGGAPALEGYLYQVDVSVWAALDLVLAKKLAAAVELEPCSQEDVEAVLPDTDPGPMALGAATNQRLLVIQAKMRTGEPWNVASVKALLQHGGPKRVSAKDRLKDSQVHYLLITTAPLTGVALGLRVRNFGQWPSAKAMPRRLQGTLHAGAAGRVAVLANEESDRIELRMKELLTGAFRVPHSKWKVCFEELRTQARAKMTGRVNRTWTREELQATIKTFDGYFASSPELEHYVRPTNWDILCDSLDRQHAVVIAGRSGTGKTITAEALWDRARGQIPGIERVRIRHGPGEVRDVQRDGPVLFDIEDPWGRYRFEPASEEWNDKLSAVLTSARADRLFVVTTRDDVLADAQAIRAASPWRVPLEAEHYRNVERVQLYEAGIPALPRARQTLAVDHRSRVLAALETPLEIQKFFDALAIVPDEEAKRGPEKISYAIDEAHRESIEGTIAKQIKARNAAHWAAIIWGLLKANAKLSRELMPEIQARLAERDRMFETGFEELVNFLVAGRSLRQADSAVSYYHPRVEAALESVMLAAPIPARRFLQLLCDVLLEFDGEKDWVDDWGRQAAARMAAAASSVQTLRFGLKPAAQGVLDTWLVAMLGREDDRFRDYLQLAARVGSDQCMPAELARFLVDRAPQALFSMRGYKPIEESVEWYQRLSADPDVRTVCEAFVRRVLPYGPGDYPSDIATHLVRLAGNLTPAFLDAALSIVQHGVNSNEDAIANGALVDLDAFLPAVEGALDYWQSLEAGPNDWAETALKIKNGEHSEDYAEHLSESAGEDGYTADELLKAYVSRLRQERGWRVVLDHPHMARLLRWWLDAVGRDDDTPSDAREVKELVQLAFASPHEGRLWELLSARWQPAFEAPLLRRVVAGHVDSDLRAEAAACLALHAPQQFQPVRDALIDAGDTARLVGLFEDLSIAADGYRHRDDGLSAIASQWASMLGGPYRELVAPFLRPKTARDWSLTAAGVELARRLAPADVLGRLTKVRFGVANAFAVDADVQFLLTATDDVEISVAAMDAAIALGRVDLVEEGLRHQLGSVRARALQETASRTTGPLPAKLLRMAEDKSRYVRETLGRLLNDRLEAGHIDALLVLAADRWSPWSGHPEAPSKYPIARAAAECLVKMPNLSQPAARTAIEVAKASQDSVVRLSLFGALSSNASPVDREDLLSLTLSPGSTTVRGDAAMALLGTADVLEESLIAKIEPRHLVQLPAPVAAPLTLVLGLRRTEAAIDAAASHLASVGSRKVFLLLLAAASASHGEEMVRAIGSLLPAGHIAQSMLYGEAGSLLARSSVDDLGDVRAVREVLWHLSERFEAE